MKLAHKMLAGYIQGEHNYSSYDFLMLNPQIKQLHMINYSAGGSIRHVEAMKAAASILHYFTTLDIPLEADGTLESAMEGLTALIESGEDTAQALGDIIDANYRFRDE